MIAGDYMEAIGVADQASTIARVLGLPEPARALAYRGFARLYLGEPKGLDEMEHALELLIEQGAGRDAAILQNNLAIARYPLQGPARSLSGFEQGIAFCAERGLAEPAAQLESNCPLLLVELGRPDEALQRVTALVPRLEAIGDTPSLGEPRAVELATRARRGERNLGVAASWLLELARQIAAADILAMAFASAAAAFVVDEPSRARALLAELAEMEGARDNPYYSRHLAAMLRTVLVAGDVDLAKNLVEGLEPRFPLDEHGLCSVRGQLAEHAGDHTEAATVYAEAAERWRKFGHVPERAYALLGEGRCLRALERPEAEQPLREAQKLFATMGYAPALADTEALLQQAEARAAARTSA
jgi:tetratricopeptide (TPR) repeat protein